MDTVDISIQLSVALEDEAIGPEDIEHILWKALRARFLSPLYTNYAVSTRGKKQLQSGHMQHGKFHATRVMIDRNTADLFSTLGIDDLDLPTYARLNMAF
jgi:hypothetical protein